MKLTSKTKLSKISGGKKVSSMKPRDYSCATEKWCETGYVSWGSSEISEISEADSELCYSGYIVFSNFKDFD